MANVAPSSRALNAILPLISSGQPYEAHQKARTFASRYQKSGQYDTAIDVLFQSARELLKEGQHGSGTDLTAFLLDVYENKGEELNDDSRGASHTTGHIRSLVTANTNRPLDSAYRVNGAIRVMAQDYHRQGDLVGYSLHSHNQAIRRANQMVCESRWLSLRGSKSASLHW